jgi:hypothetical protein
VLVTYSYYAAADEQNPPAITVDRETELMVCTDPEDPGGTEVWSAYRWTALQSGFATVQVATDAALQAAQAHLVCQEPWAGRRPWTPAHQEGPPGHRRSRRRPIRGGAAAGGGEGGQQRPGAVAVLGVGRGHDHAQQQAEGVHGDVPFAAVDLLAGVPAAAGTPPRRRAPTGNR